MCSCVSVRSSAISPACTQFRRCAAADYACVSPSVCGGEKRNFPSSLNGFSAAGGQFAFETRINANRASVCFLKGANQLIFRPRRRSRLVIIVYPSVLLYARIEKIFSSQRLSLAACSAARRQSDWLIISLTAILAARDEFVISKISVCMWFGKTYMRICARDAHTVRCVAFLA